MSSLTYLIVFDIMSLGSALILALTILTAICSKNICRGKGWFGMMSCWLVYALSYGLLVGDQLGPAPDFGLCATQAVLVYAAPPLVAVGTLSFYLDFYLGHSWDPSRRRSLGNIAAYSLLALPWLVHLAVDIEVIIMIVTSSSNPIVQQVNSKLFCHLSSTLPNFVSAVIVVLAAVVLVPLEGAKINTPTGIRNPAKFRGATNYLVWTGLKLYRSLSNLPGEDFRAYLHAYLRIAGCTIVTAAGVGLGAIDVLVTNSDTTTTLLDITFSFLPMIVALIFASQKDIWAVWMRLPSNYLFQIRNVMRSKKIRDLEELKSLV